MVSFLQRMGSKAKIALPLPPGQIGVWTAFDAGSGIAQVTDRERLTLVSGSNPRMYKQLTGLTIGASYKVKGNYWNVNLSVPSVFIRVTNTSGLASGGALNQNYTEDTAFDLNFIAQATTQFFGIVTVTSILTEMADITFAPEFLVN